MLKLVVNTLVALFLVLVIFGRDDDPAAPQPVLQASASDSQTNPVLIQKAVATEESNRATLITAAAAATLPDSESLDAPAPTPHAAVAAPQEPAITRTFPKVTNASALRSSPQYRSAEPETAAAPAGALWRVTAAALNVRSGPATSYQRVDGVTRGEEVLIVAQKGNWAHIRIEGDGVNGWVSKKFLSPSN
ncbi:SH3 domain-containing protein [Thioclava sp. GXIMD2076]|uniref:SH3 domain-containing protein n=1 Tax=Thioclava kandeliae TaxID=3070818 RepID=A0ABV1SKC8_9RHOB